MIASPFLLNIDCSPFIDGYSMGDAEESPANTSVTIAPQPMVVDRAVHLSHSEEAFFILGSIQVNVDHAGNTTYTADNHPNRAKSIH